MADFERIYDLLHLNPLEPEPKRKIQTIIQWLIDNSDCFLLPDNVVNVDVVQTFLPASSTGAIIFTMRCESAAQELGLAGRLELSHMSESEGVELILKILEYSNSTEEQGALALGLHSELGGLPLALEQVVTSSHRKRRSMGRTLRQIRSEKIETLKWITDDGANANCSIFHLAIQDLNPTTIMLLKIISHLDHQNVPKELFIKGQPALLDFVMYPKYPTRLNRSANLLKCLFSDTDEVETATESLEMSDLVRRGVEGNIWMHDLFRDLSKDLIDPSEKNFLAVAAVVLTKGTFPNPPPSCS